jgi:Helicase HerA, central domain
VLILGESGYGKTYLAQCLLWELARRGTSAVVLDVGQGFTKSELHPRLRSLSPTFMEARVDGIALNPLGIRPSDSRGPLNVAVRVSDSFARVYRIGVQQRALLRDLVLETFADQVLITSEK